jgi:hypothetical protein
MVCIARLPYEPKSGRRLSENSKTFVVTVFRVMAGADSVQTAHFFRLERSSQSDLTKNYFQDGP